MKTLILYVTKYGSTKNAIDLIVKNIDKDIDIINLKEHTPELKEYNKVVFGASVYVGKIQKEVTNFIIDNKSEILTKKIGLFIMAGEKDPHKKLVQFENCWDSDIWKKAEVREILGDEIHYKKMNFLDRLAVRLIKGVSKSFSYFDKNAIARMRKFL